MKPKTHAPWLLRFLAGSLLALSLALTTGCFIVAAGAAGAGTVAYVRGELDANIDRGYEATVQATERAVADLQFTKTGETKDGISATITSRTAQDKKVEIIVTRMGDNLTKIQIRIGFFGNELISRTILDRIKADL